MKHLLAGAALAALVATTISGPADAHHRARYHGWWGCGWYGWCGRTPHAANDFVANELNRAVLGQIGLTGAVGLDKVALNPQPLPPRQRR